MLLSDGTRALTQAGRWDHALQHVDKHHGIGYRLLDGRQIAIIAHHAAGDHQSATRLLAETSTPTPWEQTVAASLTVLTGNPDPTAMVDSFLALDQTAPGHVVFRVRLGLTVLDLADTRSAPRLAHTIETDVLRSADAYAARDAHIHPTYAALSAPEKAFTELLDASGLGAGTIPALLLNQLTTATATAEASLTDTLTVAP